MQQELVFTREEWETAVPVVVDRMKSFLSVYRVPLFKDEGDYAKGWGSGSYLRLGKRRFVLTNEHIADARRRGEFLIHQLLNNEDLVRIIGDQVDYAWPLDLALLPISEQAWTTKEHGSKTLDNEQIATCVYRKPHPHLIG